MQAVTSGTAELSASEAYVSAWTRKSDSVFAGRERHGVVVDNSGMVMVMGGMTGLDWYSVVNDVWATADGITWVQQTASAEWDARADFALVHDGSGTVYLLGGKGGASRKNDVWSSSNTGVSWTLVTSTPGWGARWGSTAIFTNDGDLLLISGVAITSTKEVYASTNSGATFSLRGNGPDDWNGHNEATYHYPSAARLGSAIVVAELRGAGEGHERGGRSWAAW